MERVSCKQMEGMRGERERGREGGQAVGKKREVHAGLTCSL